MAQSDVQIANLALDAVGTRSTIASMTENSAEARACSLHYAPALDAVLQACHWNFARKQAALALYRDATKSPPDAVPQPWLYEYLYPSDCIQGRYILPQIQAPAASVTGGVSVPVYTNQPPRFLVSSDVDDNGTPIKVILTNQPQAQLVYTARISNAGMFDGQFTQALAAYLGHRICLRLTGDKAMWKAAFESADRQTRDARASNGNEGLTVIDTVPDWIRVRGYLADWAFPPGSVLYLAPMNLTMIS